ncbi:YfcC family protein [Anaerotignum faecicola]|nr:YfcC family protein [Anaerotignum faecicola]
METKKRKIKMPSTYGTLAIFIILVAILSWIIPGGAYDYIDLQPVAGSYHLAQSDPQSLFDIIQAPINGFFDSVDIILYTLVIGGFMAVVSKTGAIDAGIGKILEKLNGKEQLMIPILMCMFAVGGATFGMEEETLPFFPIVIPIFLAAGYDTITAIAVIKLGAALGTMGSLANPFSVAIACKFADISMGDGILIRFLILFTGIPIGLFFVMRYAAMVKKDPTKSIVYDLSEEMKQKFLGNVREGNKLPEFTKQRKVILIMFALTFVIMLWGIIPFEDLGITFIPTLGWWFGELASLFLGASIIMAIYMKYSEEEFTDTFMDGARGLLEVAIVIGVARGITVVMNNAMITDTILHAGEMLLSNVSSAVYSTASYLFYFIMSFVIPSSSGLATLSMGIMAPLADFAGVSRHIIVIGFSAANAVVGFLAPTCGLLMGVLAMCKIPLSKWIKYVWKLVAAIMIVTIIILCAATIIGI